MNLTTPTGSKITNKDLDQIKQNLLAGEVITHNDRSVFLGNGYFCLQITKYGNTELSYENSNRQYGIVKQALAMLWANFNQDLLKEN